MDKQVDARRVLLDIEMEVEQHQNQIV